MPPWGDTAEDFSANILSKHTIVYSCGAIALDGFPVRHAHREEELALCISLSAKLAKLMRGTEIGLGSEGSAALEALFIAANDGDEVPAIISETVIRRAFGGTTYPNARILVEPMREQGQWWSDILGDACGLHEKEL